MADWLPKPGTITPLPDGALFLQRAGETNGYRFAVRGHRCLAEPVTELPGEAVVLPAGGAGVPVRLDGIALPPFDERPLLEALPEVAGATALGVLSLAQNPYGERAFVYRFVDGRLADLQLTEDRFAEIAPSLEAPEGMDIVWRATWEGWCRWRAGELVGEEFLEGAVLQASWPYIALVQGLFEADAFVDGRAALPPPSPDLALLRLVDW